MPEKYRTILMFGAPGVGKGTQSKMLGQAAGYCHISTGDIFRSLDRDSPEGREFVSYSSRGLLVSDELTIRLWKMDLQKRNESGRYYPDSDLLVLDGIPRSVAQAQAIDPYVDVLAILHLVAPDMDEMVQRLKKRAAQEGRHDDADESVIRERFVVYERETKPVLDFYDASLLHKINAVGTPEQVHERIRAALKSVPADRAK